MKTEKQTLDTPRNGKNWMDCVNDLPKVTKRERVVLRDVTAEEYREIGYAFNKKG